MLNYTILLAMVLSLSGCLNHAVMTPEVNIAPQNPFQKVSNYSNALENLGGMMDAYDDTQIAIMVPPVTNDTGGAGQGQLPRDVAMMVESALQNIGENVLVMAYGRDAGQTTQAIAYQREIPIYAIRGAITEFDAQTTSKSSGAQAGLYFKALKESDISVDATEEFESGTIAMDFLIMDQLTNIYMPGVKATAKATIQKNSKNRGFSFSIIGNGFGMNGSVNVKTPVHHVINLMVEYSMVQLVGKLKNYPYWLAINGADPDYRQIRKMDKNFSGKTEATKNLVVTYLMHKIDPDFGAKSSMILSSRNKAQIVKLKKQMGIVPVDDKVTTEFYMKLISDGTLLMREQQVLGQAGNALDLAFQ